MRVIAETEGLLRQALSEPGLRPEWTSGPRSRGSLDADGRAKLEALVADGARLQTRPVRNWDPLLAQAWMAGLVYLRDESSRISDKSDLTARSLLVRASTVGAFASVAGDRVLLDRSRIGAHAVLEGPLALVGAALAPYVIAGPFVVLLQTVVAHFAKMQHFVRIEKSMVGSNTAIEGGMHPETIPLGPRHHGLGVSIGRDCWIGQNCSITAGGDVGEGVVIAPHTAVTRLVPELVFVAGSPARHHPIDFNIRALAPDKAREEGAFQGYNAVGMPLFGEPIGAWRTPERRVAEIDYPRHAVLRGLASVNALHFHQGVLEATFAQIFPDYCVAIRFRFGTTVRFEVTFDRPLVEHAAPTAGLILRRTNRTDAGALPADPRALLARIEPAGTSLQALGGASGPEAQVVRDQLHGLALRGYVAPALFRRGAAAGVVEPNPEPAVLENLWRFLVNPHASSLPEIVDAPAVPKAAPEPPPTAAPSAVTTGSIVSTIAEMVRRLLSASDAIDVDAPFYQLGLDSVSTAELGVLVEAHFNVASVDIFARGTVRSLAEAVERLVRPKKS